MKGKGLQKGGNFLEGCHKIKHFRKQNHKDYAKESFSELMEMSFLRQKLLTNRFYQFKQYTSF